MGKSKPVEPCNFFKPVEFDGFKIPVPEMFPGAGEFDSSTVSYPVPDQVNCMIPVLIPGDIGDTDIILIIERAKGIFVTRCLNPYHSFPGVHERILV
jgi:hypothetical protein